MEIKVENLLPSNFREYLKNSLLDSLTYKHPYIPTKFLYTPSGSEFFKKFTELNNNHSAQLEKNVLDNFSDLESMLSKSFIIVELGAGDFDRTLNIVTKAMGNKNYHFWAIDVSPEPTLSTLKLLQKNSNCFCKLILADYELNDIYLHLSREIENIHILWFGNTCVNVLPDKLKNILKKILPISGINRTLTIGINLSTPSDEKCDNLLYNDSMGYFSEFRKSSLQLIEKELHVIIPWNELTWITRFSNRQNAYISTFRSRIKWSIKIDSTIIDFLSNEEIIVGYSHAYSFTTFKHLVSECGWEILQMKSDDSNGYCIIILKPI